MSRKKEAPLKHPLVFVLDEAHEAVEEEDYARALAFVEAALAMVKHQPVNIASITTNVPDCPKCAGMLRASLTCGDCGADIPVPKPEKKE